MSEPAGAGREGSAQNPDDQSLDQILGRLEVWGQKLGLERIAEVLERLGKPQLEVPVVLIAGTNGKGSTAALLSSILEAAGYRTGLHTSPHLERVEERFRVGGRAIATETLRRRLLETLEAAEGMEQLPTYFEALTAASYLHFARSAVDVAVIEVGLGGRLDATNVAEPILSLVTSIAFDHEEHLGHQLAQIAGEKAGVFRQSRPALCWVGGDAEVRGALEDAARKRGPALEVVDDHSTVKRVGSSGARFDEPWRWRVRTPEHDRLLDCQLVGDHQGANLAMAVRAAEVLHDAGFAHIDESAVATGVRRCRWPGRLEWVALDRRHVLLDGAHNEAGVDALLRYLAEVPGLAPLDLLFGSLSGKHAERTLPRLVERCRRVVLTEPASDRAVSAEELAGHLADAGPTRSTLEIEKDPARALEMLLSYGDDRDGGDGDDGDRRAAQDCPLLVCGSLYLIGDVRQRLRERFGRPTATVDLDITG